MRHYKLNRDEGAGNNPPRPPANANESREAREGFKLNEGQGSLFKNKHKQEGDNKPALVGKLCIEGKIYEVAVWKKPTRDGKGVWYSMSAHMPDETDAERPQEMPAHEDQKDEFPEY